MEVDLVRVDEEAEITVDQVEVTVELELVAVEEWIERHVRLPSRARLTATASP